MLICRLYHFSLVRKMFFVLFFKVQVIEHFGDVPDKIRPRLFIFNPTRFEDIIGDMIDFVGGYLVVRFASENAEHIGGRIQGGQCSAHFFIVVFPESLAVFLRCFHLVKEGVYLLFIGVPSEGNVAIVDV